jgi:hypothetical protein
MRKTVRFGLAALMAAGLFGAAPHALASGRSGGSRVSATGACSAASTWKLTATPDGGRIEVQFEVDSGVIGQTWKVRLSDNGTRFFQGTATTIGPDGSFEVRKFTTDQSGTDTILGQAKNPTTGETCQGSVTV